MPHREDEPHKEEPHNQRSATKEKCVTVRGRKEARGKDNPGEAQCCPLLSGKELADNLLHYFRRLQD